MNDGTIILLSMKTHRAGWILFLVGMGIVLGFVPGLGIGPAPRLGSVFADTYSVFAPLFLFYQSFADHLFQGTPVVIPDGVSGSCGRFSEALGFLHLEILNQTASSTALAMPALVHLRSDAAGFCVAFESRLAEMDNWDEIDLEVLDLASEEGLFAGISRMDDGLDLVFTEVFEGFLSEENQWCFAVTFAVRAMITSQPLDRINTHLADIFYGDPESKVPPRTVPETVAEAMAFLVDRSGRELTSEERADVLAAAEVIYGHFMGP